MANDLLNYLSSSSRHAKLSPEALEMMGKQAANMFLDTGLSLNEAISKLAGEHNDINPDQVKRVSEFANTAVYLAKHDQSKTAGDSSSYPQFELADPARILQDLTDGARPTVVTKTDLDYSRQPEKTEKVSSAEAERLFVEMFNTKEAEARADLDFSVDSAANEIMSAKESLTALRDHLSHSGEHFDLMMKEAQEEFYDLAKRHLMEGNSFAEVMSAARSAGVAETKVASVMKPVVERLLREKVASANRLKNDADGFSKIAHRIVNEEHPMVTSFRTILTAEAEVEKIASGLQDVEVELEKINGFIRETFLAQGAR